MCDRFNTVWLYGRYLAFVALVIFLGLSASANPVDEDTTVAEGDTLLIDNEDLILDDATLTVLGVMQTQGPVTFDGQGTVLFKRASDSSSFNDQLIANAGFSSPESLTVAAGVTVQMQDNPDLFFGAGSGPDINYGTIESLARTFGNPSTAYLSGRMSLGNNQGLINYGTLAARTGSNLFIGTSSNFDNQGTIVIEDNASIIFSYLTDITSLGNVQVAPTGRLSVNGRFGQTNGTTTLNAATGDIYLHEFVIMNGGTYNNTGGQKFYISRSGNIGLGINMYGVTLNTDVYNSERYADVTFHDGLELNATITSALAGLFRFDGTQTVTGTGTFRNAAPGGNFTPETQYRIEGQLTLGAGITVESIDAQYAPQIAFRQNDSSVDASVVVQGQVLGTGAQRDLIFYQGVDVINEGLISGRVELLGEVTNQAGAVASSDNGKAIVFGNITRNHGLITSTAGGAVLLGRGATFFNESTGHITVNNGAMLGINSDLRNNGVIDVENGAYIEFAGTSITGTGSIDVRSSTVYLNQSGFLSSLSMPPSSTNDNDRVLAGASIDLAGGELGFADVQGQRFGLIGGTLSNGTLRSLDGSSLTLQARPAIISQFSGSIPWFNEKVTLAGITLETDLTVGTNRWLEVAGTLGGSGVVTLDGGRLDITTGGTTPIIGDVLGAYNFLSGDVYLSAAIDNAGKTLVFTPGVDWTINTGLNSTITGGVLEALAGVSVRIAPQNSSVVPPVHLDGVTLAGNGSFDLLGQRPLYTRNGMGLDGGTLNIGASVPSANSPSAQLIMLGVSAITGTGDIWFQPEYEGRGGPVPNVIGIAADPLANDPNALGLTIGPGVRVLASLGDGYIGGQPVGSPFTGIQGAAAPITNQGKIILENGKDLELFTSTFNHTGSLRVDVGSTLNLITDDAMFDGQTDLAGNLIATGPVTLLENSAFIVSLSDATLTEASVQIDGTLDLQGSLQPLFLDSYDAQAGETHLLFTATGGVQGQFDTSSFHFGDGLRGNLVYYSERVELVTYIIPGDANGDGQVTAADLVILDANFGQAGTFSDGDFNGDGFVTAADLVILDANFGVGAGQPITESKLTPIPEPSSLVIFGLTGLLVARRRREMQARSLLLASL